jgi:PTS system cellobiose-specific IIC component
VEYIKKVSVHIKKNHFRGELKMKFMDKLAAWLEAKVMPVASAVGSQKHLCALRDGFVGTLPITMVGAFSVLFNNVIFKTDSLVGKELNKIDSFKDSVQPFLDKYLIPVMGQVWWGTLAMTTLFVIITISYALARAYDVDGLSAAVVAVSAYMVLVPDAAKGVTLEANGVKVTADAWGLIGWGNFNSEAMFAGMILALVSTQLFVVFTKKGWTIKMPEQVPPAVSRAFSSVIPALIIIFAAGFVGLFFKLGLESTYVQFIWKTIQEPLMGLGQSPVTYILLIVLSQMFWFFGLHGMNMVGPVLDSMYGPALNKNTELVNQGKEPIYALTRNFVDVYAMHGGSGATLCLIVAIYIFSKKQETRELAKLGTAPGIFQINEPVIFGLPLVLNPMYFIPFLITPPLLMTIAYIFTAVIPFADYLYVASPWVTPPVISAFVGTGGDFKAAILAAGLFLLGVIIYAPFVIAANKVGEDA